MNNEIKAATVVQNPVDTVVEGVITNLEVLTWSEHLKDYPERLKKMKKPDEKQVIMDFECLYNGITFKGNCSLSYSDTPTANSYLGKCLNKYGDLKPGSKIRIDYNEKGFGNIRP